MIAGGNCAAYIAVAFDRLANAEVLIKGLCTFNTGLLYALTTPDFIGCAITLECAVIHPACAGRRIVRPIAFDDVILNKRVLTPTV